MKVHTQIGLVEREQLDVRDIIEEHDNARVTATEWRIKGTDELIRRDVNVNVLRGIAVEAIQGS